MDKAESRHDILKEFSVELWEHEPDWKKNFVQQRQKAIANLFPDSFKVIDSISPWFHSDVINHVNTIYPGLEALKNKYYDLETLNTKNILYIRSIFILPSSDVNNSTLSWLGMSLNLAHKSFNLFFVFVIDSANLKGLNLDWVPDNLQYAVFVVKENGLVGHPDTESQQKKVREFIDRWTKKKNKTM
jgi:hypothetical protein